jgi:hypothetical protein
MDKLRSTKREEKNGVEPAAWVRNPPWCKVLGHYTLQSNGSVDETYFDLLLKVRKV